MATINNDLKAALTQVFKISVPEGVSGMYASSIDLFFRKKSKSFGVELNIVEVTDGQPDMKKVVPNSTVHVTSQKINVSENGSAATKFKFPQLVFLSGNTRYAFVVRPLGASSDFEMWTGVNGAKDIRTGRTISSNPLSEQAYFAKSTHDWAEIPNEDLKYKLYRAKFNIASNANAVLKKGPTEILQLKNIKYATGYPEIRAGDEVFGMTEDGLQDAEVYAKVISFDAVNNMLYLRASTGKFTTNAAISIVRSSEEGKNKKESAVSGLIASAEINTILDFPVHAMALKVGNKTQSLGSVSFSYRGTYKEGDPAVAVKETSNTAWMPLVNHEERDFYDKTRYILSHSTEVSQLQGNSSVEIQGRMVSNNDFISPIIDLRERSLVAIKNLINSDTSNEDGDYGAAKTKYISKIVTLADGQEAEDLKVFITAYKPPKTNVLVYAKVWNAEDSDEFDAKKWTLMKQVTESTMFSDPKDVEDYREFEFDMPNLPPVPGAAYSPLVVDTMNGDPVQYEGPDGVYIGFKKYSIKVVMTVNSDQDAYNYPRLSDVRAIALQK